MAIGLLLLRITLGLIAADERWGAAAVAVAVPGAIVQLAQRTSGPGAA